ncbi:TerD family protein [Streptomyces zingiberis]|uniref:TerD family protein n=1 Tax=Streptomyces zingiberis TaxID=2053010 RepID=A0ABX1C0N0_9ACTN|nr:TerD family protein [Streptomyces zingiberis]NJQ01690.1 TerD family protein [Streptomyces zingiberis]
MSELSKGSAGSVNKGLEKVQVALKWDPSPLGEPTVDLDIIAGAYAAEEPYGPPVYLVHFDSRSPDGTITLTRDSRNGQGFGVDEAMTLELYRMAPSFTRVVVGVAIQQGEGRRTFGGVSNSSVQVLNGYTELARDDFGRVAGATAATVAEFLRDESGVWEFREFLRGHDTDPGSFARTMGERNP